MADAKAETAEKAPAGREDTIFRVFVLLMVIVIVILCGSVSLALGVLGFVLGGLAAWVASRHDAASAAAAGAPSATADHFLPHDTTPRMQVEEQALEDIHDGPSVPGFEGYPGAVEYDELSPRQPGLYGLRQGKRIYNAEDKYHYGDRREIVPALMNQLPPPAGPYAGFHYGDRDQSRQDQWRTPYGNPYNTGREHAPTAAAAWVDDEANDMELDADEACGNNALSRNDATRVTAGTMNRRRDLDKYLREEVEMAENERWWGRNEV